MRRNFLATAGLTAILAGGAIAVGLSTPAGGNHLTGCTQWDGNDNNNTFSGGDGCDEMWTYGGHDEVNGHGGSDDLHMGSEYDWAHGGSNGDGIYGGDNGTSNADQLMGQDGPDTLEDEGIGDDWDLLCGGNNNDIHKTGDGDNRDDSVGEGGTDDLRDGTDSDNLIQDGTCV